MKKQLPSLTDIRKVLIESKNIISSYPIPISTDRIDVCIRSLESSVFEVETSENDLLNSLSKMCNMLDDEYIESIIESELGSKDLYDKKILRNLVLAVFIKLNGEINEWN